MIPLFVIAAAGEYMRLSPLASGKWRIAAFLRKHLSANPVRAIVKVEGGSLMDLDTADFLQCELYVCRDFERDVRLEIMKRLKPGDTFLDIGANVGFFSLCASRRVGEKGAVYAFEPAPETRKSLNRNLELNGVRNVITVPVALSDSMGSGELFLNAKHNSGAASLHQSPDSGGAVEVKLDTYDNFAEKNGLPVPALVKIDVEGAEMNVLRGMRELLSRPDRPPIILEVSEWSLKEMGSSKDELFKLMAKNGYKPHLLSRPGLSIFSGDDLLFQYDVLFMPVSK